MISDTTYIMATLLLLGVGGLGATLCISLLHSRVSALERRETRIIGILEKMNGIEPEEDE